MAMRWAFALIAVSIFFVCLFGCERVEHNAPRVEVFTPGYCGHNVLVRYRLYHDEPDASILVEYSQDGGRAYYRASEGYGGDGTRNLAASETGILHIFAWDSLKDIVDANGRPTLSTNVMLRITPYAHKKGAPVVVGPFIVNNTDNVPPTALILETAGECGNVLVKYIVSDNNGDAAKVKLEFDAGAGFNDARVAVDAGGDPLTQLSSNLPEEKNDENNQLDNWVIKGVVLGVNTDLSGKIYAELSEDPPASGTYHLSLYSDRAHTIKVAEGTITGNGRLNFTDAISGLSVAVDLTYVADDGDIELVCGRTHYLVWDSFSDLGPNYSPGASIRIVPFDSCSEGIPSNAVTIDIDNRPYPNGKGIFYDTELAEKDIGWHWSISVAMKDFDGDGHDEIVVACYSGTYVVIYDALNNRLHPRWLGTRSYPRQVLVDDFDADGRKDIFLANKGPDEFWWHSATDWWKFTVMRIGPQETRGATLGDFDGDGDNDVFVCNLGYNYIWRNDGSRNFSSVVVPFGRKEDNRGAAVSDFNRDGKLDVYVCGRFRDMIHFGNGDCTFEDKSGTNIPQDGVTSWRAVAFDYDNDGDPDIFVAKWGQNRLLNNDGNGRFYYDNDLPKDRDNSRDVTHFVRDGVNYLLIGNRGTLCRLYRVYDKRLFDVTPVNLPVRAAFTYGVCVGDVNGDGKPDAYIANDGYDTLLFGRP